MEAEATRDPFEEVEIEAVPDAPGEDPGEERLTGYNPSEGEEPPESEQAEGEEPPESAEPVVEPEPEPEQPAQPEGRSKSRTYLVFEEQTIANQTTAYIQVGEVVARNGENALRKAFRNLADERGEWPETTLVVVAERMWRPTPVKARQPRTAVAIELG